MPGIELDKTLTGYKVTVNGKVITEHHVTVQTNYAQQLTQGAVSEEVLILNSFKFLLAREPNTSILRDFDLSIIDNYFSDFEDAIKEML